MLRLKQKQLSVLGVLLASLVALSLAGARKSTPAQPTEQEKLQERLDSLESQLKEAQVSGERAAIEKDTIERIQREVSVYCEKAFNTQIIIVTIIGIIVTLVGKFGVDRIVAGKLTEASARLRDTFTKQLASELKKMNDSTAAQMEQLADDILLISRSTFYFLQGLTFSTAQRHAEALVNFGKALSAYKLGKSRHLQPKEAGAQTLANVLEAIKSIDPGQFLENAKNELADQLYTGLEEELAIVALHSPDFAPLIRDRKSTPLCTPKLDH